MQVISAIIIVSVVAFLFIALFRIRNLARIRVVLKSLPLTFTFEASADSKPGEIEPGEDERKDSGAAPTSPRTKRRRHRSGLAQCSGAALHA